VVLEKADRLGGTWRDNTYPGACCDVPSRLYSYSFALNPDWSRAFSPHDEIRAYMDRVADKFGVTGKFRFNAEVEKAVWDEAAARWVVTIKGGETLSAPVLVSGLGQLNKPGYAGIPGVDKFKGDNWHSARWRHDVDLTGKTVGCIGAGGKSLTEAWKDGAEAYLGVTVAGFPNLFMLYGPNTNLGHNSIIVMIEAQVGYMVEAMKALKRRGAKSLSVTPEAFKRFNVELQDDLGKTAWAGSCSSWYKTASGKITNNWSGDTATYIKLMKQPVLADYAVA
jgi:cation diffusion facilitator CzcD-associated flavoprotein CzcO